MTDATSSVPVVGTTVAQLGNVLGSTSTGGHDLGTALGTVVGGVVNNAEKLPVLGSTVASVGQNLKGVTSGGSAGGGVVGGQLGEVVGSAVNSLAGTPGVGKVVTAVGTTLEETTAQINTNGASGSTGLGLGSLTGVVGQVVGGVTGATSQVPVVGPVVAQVGDVLDSTTSGTGTTGNGNALGAVGQLVDGVANATSNVPVVGSVTSQLGSTLSGVTSSQGDLLSSLLGSPSSTTPPSSAGVPTVPPPSDTPSGVIVGNGGVVGAVSTLLGSTTNALFGNNSTDGYITDGSLKVSTANFTQGYSTVNALGIPVINSTPVGTVLTTVGGTVLGSTGQNSNLTLVGGVTSNSYITNINNGEPNSGLLGLVLPGSAPAWASTCLNVLGLVKESCWAVNAAQNNQVLVGDGATANGSEEVVIGTNASHTLPSVTACSVFAGNGTSTDPCGVPDANYAAREGHSVVIGDSASGTANAQTILGANATSSVANSVALGYASVASRGAQTDYTAYGLSTPQNSAGEVSIGSPGQERQITNVAAGSAATDAVNVAQLEGVATTADNAVQYDNTNKTSVTLAGTASTDGGVTGGTTITNLHQGALGATSTDAVNGSQLFATNQSLTTYMGGTTNYNPTTNTWTAPTFNITSVATDGSTTQGSYNNVTSAFDAVDGSVNNLNTRINNIDNSPAIKYFQVNSTLASSQATGTNSLAAGPAAVAGADNSMALGNGAVTSATADNAIALGAGATANFANSIALGAGSVTTVGALSNYQAYGLTAPQSSSGELNVGNRQITGVAAGSAADDAVNVAQLEGVATVAGNSVQYDNANKTSVTLGGPTSTDGGVTGGTTITNLHQGALGATSTDAVNGSQLFATNQSLATYMGGTTNYNPTTNTWTAPTFNITSVATDGSTTQGSYNNVTSAFDAVNGSLNNLNTHINTIDNSAAIKYYQVNSTLANSQATGTNSLAAGPGSMASADNSMAVGESATASGANSMAVGFGAVASSDNALAVGENATAKDGNAVAIGYGNTASGNGAVALGDPNTATGQGAVAIGYNSTATGQSAVALGSTATANGASALAMGDTASATADNAIAFGANATANNANSIALGAGSVTTVGALTNYQAYGLTTPQTSSGEVNVGNRQITGVAAGSAANDAVNVAQLEAVSAQSTSTDKLAVKYDADSSGNPTNTVTLTGDGSGAQVLVTNVAAGAETATSTDAVNGSQLWHWTQDTSNVYSNYSLYNDIQNLQNGGGGGGTVKYFNVNSTLANSSATGSNSVAIGPQATSSGTNSVAMGNGASATADNSVAIGAGSVADRANTVSVGSAGNERQITNVAAGTQATDAVNVGQLDSAISTSTQGTVHYDTNSDGSIDYSSVTLGNGSGSTAIHNVAAGTAPTDAANVGQVQQAMSWAQSYTDQRFNQAESDIQNVNNHANAGVAAAMASAGLPQAYEPGKSMAAMAGGSFRGESSVAIGVSTISEGGRWVYKVNGSADSRGDAAVSVGAGIQW